MSSKIKVEKKNAPSFGFTRRHARFKKPLCEYAALYGVSERAVKRYIRIGKQSGELPPLDQPEAMPGWYELHHARRAPDNLLAFKPAPEHAQMPPDEENQIAVNLAEIGGLTPEENVAKLRQNLEIVERRLRKAIETNNGGQIALQERNYVNILEIWRKAEATLIEIEKARGHSLPRATVETEIAQSLEMLRLSRQTMARRILLELEKLLPKRLSRIWNLLAPHLDRAIEKARAAEEQIFRNMDSIKKLDEETFSLAT